MPLSFAKVGESNIIKKISGNDEVRRHLENLGFVVGSDVSIITRLAGNVIVRVKDSRIAINEDMACRIMI